MSQQRVCRALQESGDYLSGQELSRTLGISRAAVWKAVEALRRQGYDIEARTGRGYRLIGAPDLLSRETVEQYLHRTRENLHVLETVDSTNSFCRRLPTERRCWRIAKRRAEDAGAAASSPRQARACFSLFFGGPTAPRRSFCR